MGGICCCYQPPPEPVAVWPAPAPVAPVAPVAPAAPYFSGTVRDLLDRKHGAVARSRDAKWIPHFARKAPPVVDDYRELLIATAREFGLLREIALIVREYVGCVPCSDPLSQKYRRKVLRPSPGPRCGGAPCAYCGLTLAHHLNNREPVEVYEINLMYGDLRWVAPMAFYCEIRCPIHQCSMCGRPFVKTKETHLCASCHVEWAKQPAFRRYYKPIDVNRYQDDLVACGAWGVVRAHKRVRRVRRMVKGKQGMHPAIVEEEYVERDEVETIIRGFLRQMERQCPICGRLFRYPSNDNTRAVTRGTETAVLCGFCHL